MPIGVYQRTCRPLRQALEDKCIPVPECGCWIWTAYTLPNGYGKMSYGGHPPRFAHRLSFMAFKGEIPEGMSVCHKCDTPSCVNPDHLFLGTQSDNAIDMVRKMRSYVAFEKQKTHCKRGHALAGENLYIHRSTGRRQCKACARITGRKRK
jgi:hypothetical protein